jgi:hypothetical protein
VPSFLLAFGDVLDACQPVSELVSSSCIVNTAHTDVHCEVGEQMSPMRGPAVKYLVLRAFGAPALVISFAVQGIFRGFKDTRIALSASCKLHPNNQHGYSNSGYWKREMLFFWNPVMATATHINVNWWNCLNLEHWILILLVLPTVAGSLINILLEPILMFTFHFGVSGAAVATVASQ